VTTEPSSSSGSAPAHSGSLQVVFDCDDPHRAVRFWAAALGYDIEQNPAFIRSLLDDGLVSADEVVEIDGVLFFADAVACTDAVGSRPRLLFQRVPEGKVAKNRCHLDVHLPRDTPAAARAAEEQRLINLGATRIGDGAQGDHTWVILTDPEGNEFCLG
jgi:Glyoxalase-like domain